MDSDETRFSRYGLPALGGLAVLVIWSLGTVVFHVSSFVLPAPWDVIGAFWELPGFMLLQAWTTLFETLVGFGGAVIAALLIALVVTSWRPLDRMVMPVMVVINSVPKLAVAPLLVIWMGFGPLPKIVMVGVISFFPILLAAAAGLKSTPGDLNELARSLSASHLERFLKVRLPWALPQIFTGLKVGISLAVIGAVVAELSGSTAGLGFVVSNSSTTSTAQAFAAVVLLSIESLGLFYLVSGLEKLLLPWVKATTAQH